MKIGDTVVLSTPQTSKRLTIKIDFKHSIALCAGHAITIKVPPDAGELTLQLDGTAVARENFSFAKALDVFFNGRPA